MSANEVKAIRLRLGLTQERFAHAIEVTVSTVNRWERDHCKPSLLARRAIERLVAQERPAARPR